MDRWKEYALSIIICALCCGTLSGLISDGKRKKLIQLVSGILMALVILYPVAGMSVQSYGFGDVLAEYRDSAQSFVDAGMKAAISERERYIKDTCAAYISNKAAEHGAEITAEIYLDENLVPVRAEILGHTGQDAETEIIRILEADLGITKENQLWIWEQEGNSS